MKQHSLKDWSLLLALVAMWGSAFLFNTIALQSFPPAQLVTARLVIGAIVLIVAALWYKVNWKVLDLRLVLWFIVMAIVGNALPFYLIAWGQQTISSSLAGILMAVMPLATLLMAHFLLPEEKLTKRRAIGFSLGFIGIIVLMGPSAMLEIGSSGKTLMAQFAVLGGALCYALGTIIARLRPESSDLLTSTMVLIFASLLTLPFSFINSGATENSFKFTDITPAAAGSALFLGLIATGLATVLYFKLLRSAGATFLSMINYLIPVWALLAGVLLLHESVSSQALIALSIILLGIAVSQVRRRFW
ncbi:MAG TPA: EamA/RhaT family transporter [Gammaproteobacteria bacterium]|nr:EamA/RhaT family transporter [Gammaproteobacteria bacterium]